MAGISYKISAIVERVWLIAVLFMLLSISTNSIEPTKTPGGTTLPKVGNVTTEIPHENLTTESSHLHIPHINVTAVTGKAISCTKFCHGHDNVLFNLQYYQHAFVK